MLLCCCLTGVFVHRVQYFRKKQPQAESNFNNKLPDFVRRLEDALYKDAKSLVS
jgi:hypothetical protein